MTIEVRSRRGRIAPGLRIAARAAVVAATLWLAAQGGMSFATAAPSAGQVASESSAPAPIALLATR